jgi:histidine ammonia-lyase
MVITLDSLNDFTLANFACVSRAGATVRPGDDACVRIRDRRASFIRFIDGNPTPWIYNVTGGIGDATLDTHERRALARRHIAAGAVLSGEALSERIVRAR